MKCIKTLIKNCNIAVNFAKPGFLKVNSIFSIFHIKEMNTGYKFLILIPISLQPDAIKV